MKPRCSKSSKDISDCYDLLCSGTKLSEEHRQKLKEFNRGKRLSEEHKKKIGTANSKSLLGKKLSNEHKANIKKGLTP